MKRIIRTRPPFDKRSDIPGKNYGICGFQIWFILQGKFGAVQVMLSTELYPKKVMKELIGKDKWSSDYYEEVFNCWDVGYHSKKRPKWDTYKWVTQMDCDLLPGGKCYYDGSSLRGKEDKVVQIYMEKGDDGIFEYLEKYYVEIFGELK